MLDTYLELLDLDFFELTEAFSGLADQHVWQRPVPELLSVGELAGHIAFWEATRFAGEGADLAKCRIKSPLLDPPFRYYTTTLESSPTDAQLALSAEAVGAELQRIHRETAEYLRDLNPDLDTNPPGWSEHWTYRESLKYTIFHVAYHTGQMYSVRHLLGEVTPDN